MHATLLNNQCSRKWSSFVLQDSAGPTDSASFFARTCDLTGRTTGFVSASWSYRSLFSWVLVLFRAGEALPRSALEVWCLSIFFLCFGSPLIDVTFLNELH